MMLGLVRHREGTRLVRAAYVVRTLASGAGGVAVAAALLGLLGLEPEQVEAVPTPRWEVAYSDRYPGCVSMPLWPLGERPVALVTRTPDGMVDRVPLASLYDGAAAGHSYAIGACR